MCRGGKRNAVFLFRANSINHDTMDAQTIIQNRQVNLALDRLINCSDFVFLQRFVMDGITLQNSDYNEEEKEDINALFTVLNELSRSVRCKNVS